MTSQAWIGLAVVVVTLLVHTGALFYWGGGVRQILRDHERRISKTEQQLAGVHVPERRSVPRTEF